MKRAKQRIVKLDEARASLLDAISRAQPKPTLKDLSLRLGRNHAYLHQYIYQGKPQQLPEDVRLYLSKTLNVDEYALMGERVRLLSNAKKAVGDESKNGGGFGAKDLPIFGKPSSDPDRFILSGEQVGLTERPTYFVGVTEAFAIYVSIESMHPRFKPGELVFINPYRPAISGDDVLVEFHDGTGTLKEFIRKDKLKILVSQYNPKKELAYQMKEVKAVLLVEGTRRR